MESLYIHLIYSAIVIAVAVVSILIRVVRNSGLKSATRKFARANNLKFLGTKLPEGFVFRGTGLQDVEVSNVIRGELHGAEMVAFVSTHYVKEGKRTITLSQSIYAVPNLKQLGSRQIPPTGDANLYCEVACDWIVLYSRNVVVAGDEVARWCERMGEKARYLTSRAV